MSRTARLGIFIVAALMILSAGVFLIGSHQMLFSPTYRLQASFGTVAGLGGGAEVRIGGIHEGTVKQIRLPTRPDEKVTVMMDLARSTRGVIKKDSVASIQTEGLLGNKYVEISFGSNDAPVVHDGDTIEGEPPLDISDVIRKTNEILDTTKVAMGNVGEVTDNLKAISSKINRGEGTVGALINDKKIYEEVAASTAQAKAGTAAFRDDMEALKQNWFLRGFFKKRGYTDSAELTKNAVAHLPEGPYIKKFSYDAGKLFARPDGAQLKNGKALDEAGKFLEGDAAGWAVVAARTGMNGDSEKDLELTQAWAAVVRDYLVKNFKMDDNRLKTIGLGKQRETDSGKSGGVEIIVYPVKGADSPAKYQAKAAR